MPKIDPDYSAITNDPTINIRFSEPYVDVKVILMALRDVVPHQHVYLAPSFEKFKYNVVVPTLRVSVAIKYRGGEVHVISRMKRYKFPCELENFMLPEWAIDVIVKLFMHNHWHKRRFRF